MKLLVATDAHIFTTPDGKNWCKAIYGYQFWTRYLSVFDSVRIVARRKYVEKEPGKCITIDGPGVEIFGIPFYQGPKQLLSKYARIRKVMKGAFEGCDCAIYRLPSQTAQMAYEAMPAGMPFAGEIVYNPMDDVKNPECGFVERMLSRITARKLRSFCKKANGVSYVTADAIQRDFPSHSRLYGPDDKHFEASYSTITLPEAAFTGPRDFTAHSSLMLTLSDVAMNSERKGERVLIHAVAALRKRGYRVEAKIIGDGSKRSRFEALAQELGVAEQVHFVGLLPTPEDVRKVLLECDVFMFPTQGEGLPRGILEAMALGMPVLSTPVGGIPEILDNRYLFAPTDTEGFTNAIAELMDDKEKLNTMSAENFRIAQSFKDQVLQARRVVFYEKLKALTKLK